MAGCEEQNEVHGCYIVPHIIMQDLSSRRVESSLSRDGRYDRQASSDADGRQGAKEAGMIYEATQKIIATH